MAQTTADSPRPRRRGWRILGWTVLVLIILLVIGYFVVTSSAFVKAVVLPRVGASLNADITVREASIHPFSAVVLRDLKLVPHGREPLLAARTVRARYALFDILGGNIRVDELTIDSPVINLVERADGSSNLDPIKEALAKHKGETKKPSGPTRLDLRKITLASATLRRETAHADGGRDVAELSNLNVSLENVKNGDTGKLTLSSGVSLQNDVPAPGTNSVLQGSLDGEYTFALSADLKPLSVKGHSQLAVTRAEGALDELAMLAVSLDCDVAPTEIHEIALRFKKGDTQLGELRASGPFNAEKTEGRLTVELRSLDRRVLNLFGAASGLDFGTTAINSTNQVQIADAGSTITIAGRLEAAKAQVIRANQTTPTLEFRADYDATLNRGRSNAVLRTLTFNGTQDGRPLLHGELTSPMTLALGGAGNGVGDSNFDLALNGLNLADWKAFLGDISEGRVDAKVKILSQQGGNRMTFDLASQFAGITPIAGGKTLASAVIGARLTTQFGTNGDRTVQGGVLLSNIVVRDPQGQLPATPLEARLEVDATLGKQSADVRDLQIALTPTSRAQNRVRLNGRVDFSRPNAIAGNLMLASDGLDLTGYYDLFAGKNEQAAPRTAPAAAPETPATNAPAAPKPEPAAVPLPFGNVTVQANVPRLYLRTVEITNLQTTASLNGSHARLQPFELTLNGGKVAATIDLDLGVEGFRYSVDFRADRVPIGPLADSFSADYRGRAKGDLLADLSLKGAGVTGVNLQKNLSGHVNLVFTNANIQLAGPKLRHIIVPISEALRVPELADSPVNWLSAKANVGNGKIELAELRGVGEAFTIRSQGTIPIDAVLMNSPLQNLPVDFALSRSLAERAHLNASSGDTNSNYVELGTIAHVNGTLETPQTKADYARLALLTGQSVPGKAGDVLRGIGGVGSSTNVGGALQNLGNAFLGNRGGTNAASGGTNQPPPKQLPGQNILNDLLGPKRK